MIHQILQDFDIVNNNQIAPMNSIPKAHATGVQKISKAVSRNRVVYRFRGPFFVPFLGKQKRKIQNEAICIFIPATKASK